MSTQLRICLKIAHRSYIGRQDTQYLASSHIAQCLLRLEQRQWAAQAAGIQFAGDRMGKAINSVTQGVLPVITKNVVS